MPKAPKCFQENVGNEVNYYLVDARESFIQVHSIKFGVCSQTCSKYSKKEVCNIFAISQDEVGFLSADKNQSFFKLILSFQVCVAKHAQITQNNKFAISLQYLKIDMNIDMNRYEKILQIGIIVLMEVASHIPSTQYRKFLCPVMFFVTYFKHIQLVDLMFLCLFG